MVVTSGATIYTNVSLLSGRKPYLLRSEAPVLLPAPVYSNPRYNHLPNAPFAAAARSLTWFSKSILSRKHSDSIIITPSVLTHLAICQNLSQHCSHLHSIHIKHKDLFFFCKLYSYLFFTNKSGTMVKGLQEKRSRRQVLRIS